MSDETQKDYRVGDDSLWSRAWVAPLVIAIAGGLLAVFTADMDRLGYSYLFGLFATTTLMLGGLFLVLIQFMTGAHWGVSTRRIAEVIMSGAPVVALLALPFLFLAYTNQFTVYHQWQDAAEHAGHGAGHDDDGHDGHDEHGALELGASVAHAQDHGDDNGDEGAHAAGEHGEAHAHTSQETALHHEVIAAKTGYLNPLGWLVRGLAYLAIWCLIALAYYRWSRQQDVDRDVKHTVRMQSLAPPALIVFAGALTFAAFDWVMSLEAAWYSTIFGVIIFAGSTIAILAVTILIGISLFKRGLVGDAINLEHFHDLGKLLFGFICFWTYVSFSQWMLIWYAGIPEEAIWYHNRWQDGWPFVAYLLIFGHFVAPFVLLISRVQKRNLRWLQVMCYWAIFVHILDIYWFVLPQAGGFHVHPADIGALFFVGGLFFAYVFWQLTKVPLIPVGDPRLARSLHHHQTH